MILEYLCYGFIFILLIYVYNRLTIGISTSSTCLIGKTAIVTGGNSGIGYEVVKILASRGCRVIIADIVDASDTCKILIKETNNPNIVPKYLDLANFDSVRKFAKDFNKSENRLDILINNAGIAKWYTEKTVDGYPDVMQINYLGPFLLTHLLLNKLKKSAPSRIVFTSSSLAFTHSLTKFNFLDNQSRIPLLPINLSPAYSNSKIAIIIASSEIARRLKGTGVTIYAVHPGVVNSSIFTNTFRSRWYLSMFIELNNLICARTSWEGAQTTIHTATALELKGETGEYYWDCKKFFKPRLAQDKEFCRWLYQQTEESVKLKEDERMNIDVISYQTC